ncbi:MFS transporter [Paraburkholderia sp. Se-20369]|nr:MFS transporter [Paraburkholderia sp. Se-20369]
MTAAQAAPQRAWRLRYWSIFAGQALSRVGSALTQFVLLWWITDITGSVTALGMAGFAALLPQALLGPLGGVFADRYSRRVIMIVADAVAAACMIVLIVLFPSRAVELWHIYVMMAIRSAMQAFQQPAAAASAPMPVPDSFLGSAIGLNQSLLGIMTVGAARLGALALSAMPIGWALGIDVVTALLGIVPLLVSAIPQPDTRRNRSQGIWHAFREGVDTVWHDVALRRLCGVMIGTTFVIMPLFTLVPLLIKVHFGGGAADVAVLESAGGIGMLALLATLLGLIAPIGLAIATPLGEWIGVRMLFVVLGVLAGLALLAGFLSSAIRDADALERARCMHK